MENNKNKVITISSSCWIVWSASKLFEKKSVTWNLRWQESCGAWTWNKNVRTGVDAELAPDHSTVLGSPNKGSKSFSSISNQNLEKIKVVPVSKRIWNLNIGFRVLKMHWYFREKLKTFLVWLKMIGYARMILLKLESVILYFHKQIKNFVSSKNENQTIGYMIWSLNLIRFYRLN